jgi:hypothetical protein
MTSAGPAPVVTVHDGFYGFGTGAGRSNRAFLQVLCELLDPSVRLTVLPVRLAPDSAEYDAAWHRETVALIGTVDGSVVPLDNGTAGQTRFGSLGNFRRASASAAAEITRIFSRASPALAVAFDAPFFGIAPALSRQDAARTVNVARATAALHAPADQDRIEWERCGLLATARAGGRIAATSRHIRQHLADAYSIPPSAITDLINGLTPGGPPLTPYQQHLADRVAAAELCITLHTAFTPGLRGLLADPRLAAVILPSRAEPFGRIPLEAYAVGASPVIATTARGLAAIVTEGRTGYTAEPADPPSLARAISRALAAPPAQRRHLLAAGQTLTRTHYDYRANVAAFLAAVAPWAAGNPQSA